MSLREAFAATHHASLQWNPDSERAIDRVAASGLCDPLGVLIWKAKFMLESDAYREAQLKLKSRIREQFPNQAGLNMDKVVEQAFREYLSDKCQTCIGRGSVTLDKLKITCEDCSGSGMRRYTDFERARYTQLALGRIKTLQRHFNWAINEIMTLDREVNQKMADLLER